jgi:Coenzyme PQQ synthesis protein D (PqqD)
MSVPIRAKGEKPVERAEVRKDSTFVMQSQDMVLESFSDETVAVNLGTGRYFSIDLVGTEIIDLVRTGSEFGTIVSCLVTRYGADEAFVDDAVLEFVGRLLDEGLVRPAPDGGVSSAIPEAAPAAPEFTRPTLTVYSDMEDLLLLDPIHDVDETGWPMRAEAAESDQGASHDTE